MEDGVLDGRVLRETSTGVGTSRLKAMPQVF